jgi:hypothetical protein
MEVYLHAFLTSALDGSESTSLFKAENTKDNVLHRFTFLSIIALKLISDV